MRAVSTSDVPLEILRELSRDLSPDFELDVDGGQFSTKSPEAPSWVTFLANADWWIKVLAAYAAVYVVEIVKEAGRDTWKNRGKAVAAGVVAGKGSKKLTSSIVKFRQRLLPTTRLRIALPIPNDHFATSLDLLGADPIDLEFQVALFVHHLPALTALIQSEQLEGGRVLVGINLKILPDASLEVSWMDKKHFEQQRRVLPLKTAD
jgi:hypothetical protein